MKNKKVFFIAILICITLIKVNAQTPANDQNWNLIFTDDFNTRPASPNWIIRHLMDRGSEPQILLDDPDNVFVNNGNLYLRTIKENYTYNAKTYPYTSGWVETVAKYKYGYFEVRAICPSGKGYWPAFWLQTGADAYCNYNEIDIFENDGGNQYYWSNNMHYQIGNDCNPPYTHHSAPKYNYSSPVKISDTWHVWGCEWSPNVIIFYLDGIELRRVENIQQNQLMPIILNQSLYPFLNPDDSPNPRAPDITTPINGDFVIDYLKVYKLKNTTCSSNVTIGSFSSYIPDGIKNSIQVGNGTTPIDVPVNSSMILRAVSDITINNNFFVPLGSDFGAVITPCYY